MRPDSRLRLSTRDVKSIIETVDASVVESTLGVYESAKAQQLSDSLGALDSAGCFRFAFFGKESADNSVDPLVVERTPDESTSRVTQVFPEALRYLSSDLERVDERPQVIIAKLFVPPQPANAPIFISVESMLCFLQTEVSAGAAQTSIEAAMRVLLDAGFRPLSAEDVELSDSLGSEPPGRLELRTDESRLDAAPLAHLVDPLAGDTAVADRI